MADQTVSVELNGTNESFRSIERNSFDITNEWTIAITFKPIVLSGKQALFHLNDADVGENDNTILLETDADSVRTLVVGSKGYGSPGKMLEYNNVLVTGTWTHLALTWDGSSQELDLYKDGTFLSPSNTIFRDFSIVMTSSIDKSLWIGENKDLFDREFNGRVYSSAIWDTVLPSGTISGIAVDAQSDLSGAEHWWRFGFDALTASGIGTDYGSSVTAIPLNSGTSNIGISNVVSDYPT